MDDGSEVVGAANWTIRPLLLPRRRKVGGRSTVPYVVLTCRIEFDMR